METTKRIALVAHDNLKRFGGMGELELEPAVKPSIDMHRNNREVGRRGFGGKNRSRTSSKT